MLSIEMGLFRPFRLEVEIKTYMEINKTNNNKIDYNKVNQERLEFFKGWIIDNTKNHFFIDFK